MPIVIREDWGDLLDFPDAFAPDNDLTRITKHIRLEQNAVDYAEDRCHGTDPKGNPRIAAAEISVRRLARTSERTSMRCSSRPLIVTKSQSPPPPTVGRVVWTFQLCRNRTFLLCAYKSCPVAAKLICLNRYKVELSKFNSSRSAVRMW